jgi:hypothetical protein
LRLREEAGSVARRRFAPDQVVTPLLQRLEALPVSKESV